MVSLPCKFPEVPYHSSAVFTKSLNEGLERHVAKLMKDWPSPLPLVTEADVTGTCRPVPFFCLPMSTPC